MKRLLPLLLLLAHSAWANLHLAPPDFNTDRGRAVFVDFKSADYEIIYDLKKRKVKVRGRIVFEAQKAGTPLFDLVPIPSQLRLNGEPVSQRPISFPGKISTLRQLSVAVTPGEHVLEMENTFSRNTRFNTRYRYVSSAFWIRDLKDRMFLEQYLPSNFEFDQYKITMDVKFVGNGHQNEIYTNGVVTQLDNQHYKIEYPEYFTSSCLYFHTAPKGLMKRLDFAYQSISGREVPITVYSRWESRNKKFKAEALKVMKELEADYGPWAHPSLVAYGTFPGTGGMEHAGATATSFGALGHELLHSYFAKGIMPANGNSGWIDEAIAAWRDRGYPRLPGPGFEGSNLGNHSPYTRKTDTRAYSLGSSFLAYLDWKLQDMGGLKAFLRGYFEAYKYTVVTTEHFKNSLEFWSGLTLSEDFEKYIWGENSHDMERHHGINPVHGPMGEEELQLL